MRTKKFLLPLLLLSFCSSFIYSQIPSNYLFYQGDTLQGFDMNACMTEAHQKQVTPSDMRGYLKHKERDFVFKKYHIQPKIEKTAIGTPNAILAAPCDNLGFEAGAFTGWTALWGENDNSTLPLSATTAGFINLGNNSAETTCSYETLVNTGNDFFGGFPMLFPGGGTWSCRLGGRNSNEEVLPCQTTSSFASPGESISLTFPVTALNAMFTYSYAVVLEDAPHSNTECPYFRAQIFDHNGVAIPCLQYYIESANGAIPPGMTTSAKTFQGDNIYYNNWATNSLNLFNQIGNNVTVTFTAAGCYAGGHMGYAYVDATCGPITMLSATPNVCVGGTISMTAPHSNPGSTYAWNTMPAGTAGIVGTTTNQVVTVNANGTYQVTVTQAPGCTYTIDTTITMYPLPVPTSTSTNTTCAGNVGTANAANTLGNGPFTYAWAPAPGGGQGTPNATALGAGSYVCTVTTANGCKATTTAVVTAPNAPTATPASTPAKCFGGTDGTATANAVGGTPAYTYAWTPAPATGQTGATATALPAGVYTCTITDTKSCTVTQVVTVTQPTVLAATNTQVNVLCKGGNNGSITVTPSGGTGPYTYAWTPAPAAGTGATASSLTAGAYVCTITDANACTTTSTATITEPTQVTNTSSFVGAVCGQSNGSATVTAAGGTPGYTYLWSPVPGGGQGTVTATGIPAGNYTCTITDANGCFIKPIVAVPNTGGPVVTMGAPVNVTCNGLCNGSLTATSVGGVAPVTFAWTPAPPVGQGTLAISSLCPATYILTATDGNGCTSTATGIITQPAAIPVTATSTNVKCFGGTDGTATGTASGGTAPLTYVWSPAPLGGQSTLNATGLSANTYTLTVTDANGCTNFATTTITQPALLTILASGINATCPGLSNGQLICIPSGGTAAYIYAWNTGCAAASCTGIGAGTYNVTVTDAHGCTATANATVTEPPPLTLSMFPKAAHCNHPDGKDSAIAGGGNGGFTYLWKPSAPVVTTPGIQNIIAGSYTVIIKDAQGCIDSMTNVVPNLPGVNITLISTVDVTCFGGTDGKATVAGTGGILPYTYAWSPAPATASGNSTTASNLSAGTYTCTISDSANCQNKITCVINQPTLLTLAATPGGTICIGACAPLAALAAGGSPGYVYSWTLNGTPTTSPVCPLVTTTYTATCTDSHGCVSPPVNVTITVNPPLEVVAAGGKSICPGVNATLSAIGTGGNGNYSYQWIPTTGIISGGNTASPVVSPAVTTTYTVIVSDNCGTPTDSAMVTITLYPAPIVNFTTQDTLKCAPMCATFVGVSAPGCQSAIWNFGDGTTGTGCAGAHHCYNVAGTYNISYTVIDVNGCPGTLTIPNFINVWPKPTASFNLGPQPTTIVNPDIYFTNTSPSSAADSIVSWSWVFGDWAGATSLLQNPKYTYPDTGCFVAQLTITNQFGCTDITTRPLCIQPEFTFYAPNTFTPNGDGHNDVWMPYGIGIDPKNYHLMIFDRWGNLLFETHTWGEGWDGRANGGANIAQIDTYVWKVILLDVFHSKHQYLGHCNIIK
jgi:gliding motility-associated-like protein